MIVPSQKLQQLYYLEKTFTLFILHISVYIYIYIYKYIYIYILHITYKINSIYNIDYKMRKMKGLENES